MTSAWPLPIQPHVPGKSERPTASPAFDAAAAAPAYTVDRMWSENATYLYGIDLYRAGFFWEAHEVWEPVWLRSAGNSRERLLVQGLIQLSNACLKIAMDRPDAAARLLTIAREKISEAALGGATIMGIALTPLADVIAEFASRLAQIAPEHAQTLLDHRPSLNVEHPATATQT